MNLPEHIEVLRSAQAKAADHRQRNPKDESGKFLPNHHQILASIFREAQESGIAVRDHVRQRMEVLAPLVELEVRNHLAALNLAPRNPTSPNENTFLERAIREVIVPMTPAAGTLFTIGGCISELNSVDDITRHLEAVELLAPLDEQFEHTSPNPA